MWPRTQAHNTAKRMWSHASQSTWSEGLVTNFSSMRLGGVHTCTYSCPLVIGSLRNHVNTTSVKSCTHKLFSLLQSYYGEPSVQQKLLGLLVSSLCVCTCALTGSDCVIWVGAMYDTVHCMFTACVTKEWLQCLQHMHISFCNNSHIHISVLWHQAPSEFGSSVKYFHIVPIVWPTGIKMKPLLSFVL